MQQVKQFQDSPIEDNMHGDFAQDVWKKVNPFLRQHADGKAHVIDVNHQPAGLDGKSSYRVVSVAYNTDFTRKIKRLMLKYNDVLNEALKETFNGKTPKRSEIKKVVHCVQCGMAANEPLSKTFRWVTLLSAMIHDHALEYSVGCGLPVPSSKSVVINGRVRI